MRHQVQDNVPQADEETIPTHLPTSTKSEDSSMSMDTLHPTRRENLKCLHPMLCFQVNVESTKLCSTTADALLDFVQFLSTLRGQWGSIRSTVYYTSNESCNIRLVLSTWNWITKKKLFHNLGFKCMMVYNVHEATRLHRLWVEWLYSVGAASMGGWVQ